ncbi:pilus assembly protein [Izhakiella australiensis]|uniref:Pilus assembly protein n=1 Tax=Izhakiella australiensis TaxID=1926881 RepID=A0A1S8YMC1_9GAMM|nr:fimbria/pilus periplasmic chaperone [Izhakiella australiensis]OON40190.1 pilus assembly protein [Izhakiella australiensis]
MKKRAILLAFAMLAGSFSAIASMTISGTRIIFPAAEKEVNVRTNNKGTKPALVQVWIDDNKGTANLNEVKVPFIVTPPIYRVESGKGQSVRLIYNGMILPQNKESVFWFNMLEIPPQSTLSPNRQRLELAFRTRIKIFYRPDSLSESNSANERNKLKWETVTDAIKGVGIKLTNPTPYYFSFDESSVETHGKKINLNVEMADPFSSIVFYPERKINKGEKITSINYGLINDYGAVIKIKLSPQGNGFFSDLAGK